jgi:M6 family metalloprotease-like protein
MKKLAVVVAGLLVVTGCSSVEPENVSYPIQTEGNVQNRQQTEDVSVDESYPSDNESESVDAPIVEEEAEKQEVVQENVQVSEPEPTEVPTLNAPIVDDKYQLSYEIVDDGVCKLKETSGYRMKYKEALASSFPSSALTSMPYKGKIKISLVFMQWEDLKGTQADYDYHIKQLKMFENFYWNVSEGKLDLQIDVNNNWFTAEGSYTSYITPDSLSGGGHPGSTEHLQPILDKFIEASDPEVDYSDTEMIIFGIPRAKEVWLGGGLHEFGKHSRGAAFAKTSEGNIYNFLSAGSDTFNAPTAPAWTTLVHEAGHALGMPDLRDWSDRSINEAWFVNPMLNYDIMDVQTSIQRTIGSWLRWVQGWLDDDQVTCVIKEDVDNELYAISHLDDFGAQDRSLVIKINSTTNLVVESRRWRSNWDIPVVHSVDGVIVYRVDSTLGHSEGPMRLLTPTGRDITKYLREPNTFREWRSLDVVFKEGDSVTYDGITITVEKLGSKDIVRVSR